VISVTVGDGIEEATRKRNDGGFEIVHPLTTEPGAYEGSSFPRHTAT